MLGWALGAIQPGRLRGAGVVPAHDDTQTASAASAIGSGKVGVFIDPTGAEGGAAQCGAIERLNAHSGP